VLTATSVRHSQASDFVLRAVVWSIGLFAVLRLGWIEAHAVLPATQWQGRLAAQLFGAPGAPIETTVACSGTDALALCLAALFAYPARWRSRVSGAAGAVVLILSLNTLRIGTLGRVAASPAQFQALHLYVWPAILTLAIAGYVFWWMQRIDGPPHAADGEAMQPSRQFIALSVAFLFVFVVSAPLVLQSAGLLALAVVVAQSAGLLLNAAGVSSQVVANVLLTPGGNFLVTQECIATPLIPVYLAAVCAYGGSIRRTAFALIGALPLFMALGVVRLLLVALPATIASPLFFVHAFYQLALAVVVIGIAAAWRHGRVRAARYALAGIALATAFMFLTAPLYSRIAIQSFASIDDPQGAIAFLPVFQGGLYLALAIAAVSYSNWKLLIAGFTVLTVTQAVGVIVLQSVAAAGAAFSVRDIRAWSIVAPVLIVAVIANVAPPRR
jgi:exosortase/archaeosortase family protein